LPRRHVIDFIYAAFAIAITPFRFRYVIYYATLMPDFDFLRRLYLSLLLCRYADIDCHAIIFAAMMLLAARLFLLRHIVAIFHYATFRHCLLILISIIGIATLIFATLRSLLMFSSLFSWLTLPLDAAFVFIFAIQDIAIRYAIFGWLLILPLRCHADIFFICLLRHFVFQRAARVLR